MWLETNSDLLSEDWKPSRCKRIWVILPDQDIEVSDAVAYAILPLGADRWKVQSFDDTEIAGEK